MAQQLEVGIVEQMGDVVLGPGEEIIQAEHVVAGIEQAIAEMRAEKPRPAGDEDAFAEVVVGHGGGFGSWREAILG